jgi:glucokinase
LVSEEANFIGIGIVNLLHLFSPELVVIGGGVSSDFRGLHAWHACKGPFIGYAAA